MNITTGTILFYLPSFEAGGAERQALNLAIELKTRHNYHVVLAAQYKGGPIEIEALRYDINCIEIPFDFYYFNFYKLSGFSISKFKAHLKFKAIKNNYLTIVKQVKPDFIFSYCYEPNVIASYFSNDYKNCKVIWNQRDTGIPPFTKCKIEQIAINNAFKIIGNSASAIHYVTSIYNVTPKCSVIKNGVELTQKEIISSRVDFGFNDHDFIIGMIANYSEVKNHQTLIKAYHQLKDESIKLILIGRFTDDVKKKLCSLTTKDIKFHYQNTNIASIINMCNVIVHPSLSEGLPNGVLEAMMCKKLVIVSNIDPHKEILGSNYSYMFSVNDDDLLSKLINQSKSQNNELIINENYNIVNSNFSVSSLSTQYYNLIHE